MLAKTIKKIWNTLVQVYNEFSIESTIHGVKHTMHAKSISGRILWVIIITSSFLAAAKLAFLFYERHQSASMSTLIVSPQFPNKMIPLPAVTLCHGSVAVMQKVLSYLTSQERMYGFGILRLMISTMLYKFFVQDRYIPRGLTRKDFEHTIRYLREAIYPKNNYPEELDKLQQILTANRLSLTDLFESVNPNCTDLMIMCRLNGKIKPCENLVNPVITPYGICCAFNYEDPQENQRRSNEEPKTYYSVNFGARYVISFLMRPVQSHDRMSSIMYGEGIKVLIHEKYTYPGPTAFEFVAASGRETIAKLYPTALTSSSEIQRLSPATRGCYVSNPSQKNRYRADNCNIHCRENIMRKLCGCIPFSASIIETGVPICNFTHITCLARNALQTYTLMLQDSECNCLPDCESTSYKVAVTTLPLSAIQYSPGQFYETAARIKNATALHITFARHSAMLQRRELVLSWINLISSLGGVFGLFLGCSFISLVEIIYFFCIHFSYRLRYKSKTPNSDNSVNKDYN